jgi:flagellar motor switch/type III secretory pathway protein FliN
MKKEKTNPDILLPESACELCGFTGEEKLELHAAKDTLVIVKTKMTVMELVHVIDTLSEIASELTVHLAKACGFCNNCGDSPDLCGSCAEMQKEKSKGAAAGSVEWVKDCELCQSLLEADEEIQLPDYLLEEAGIPKDAKLTAYADEDSGEITVSESENEYDISDVPPGLRAVLATSGVCLMELEELITLEETIYGDE